MVRTSQLTSLALAFSLLTASFFPSGLRAAAADESHINSSTNTGSRDEPQGLRFRLSQAAEQPEARPVPKLANAVPLSQDEAEAIVKRLQPAHRLNWSARAERRRVPSGAAPHWGASDDGAFSSDKP
ncbi:MAG: hypothetical protein ACRD6N_09595 [Pyrinomonadaceae bacterium]